MDNHVAVGTIGLAASGVSITQLPNRPFSRQLDTQCCDSAVDVWACHRFYTRPRAIKHLKTK
jgi:hypothetical protein